MEKEAGVLFSQAQNWPWFSGSANGVSEGKPDPKVPSANSLSVHSSPSPQRSAELGQGKQKGGERNGDRELEGPLRALESQVTKLVQSVGFPSF